MPSLIRTDLERRPDLCLAAVEYAGWIRPRPAFTLPDLDAPEMLRTRRSLTGNPFVDVERRGPRDWVAMLRDERHVLRVQVLRVVGPVWISPDLPQPIIDALRKDYGEHGVIDVGSRVLTALPTYRVAAS